MTINITKSVQHTGFRGLSQIRVQRAEQLGKSPLLRCVIFLEFNAVASL